MKTVVKAKRRFTERSNKHKPMALPADHKAVNGWYIWNRIENK